MNSDSASAAGAAGAFGAMGIMIVVYLVVVAFGLYLNWRVVGKAGYPAWYSLGALVPCLGLVLLIMFAFTEWPIERELNALRNQMPQPGSYPRYPADPQA